MVIEDFDYSPGLLVIKVTVLRITNIPVKLQCVYLECILAVLFDSDLIANFHAQVLFK